MSYILFILTLLTAALILGLGRLIGFRVNFEPIFKTLGNGLVFLPIALMSILFVFMLELLGYGIVILILHLTGTLQYFISVSDKLIIGIMLLVALAFGLFNWIRIVCFYSKAD